MNKFNNYPSNSRMYKNLFNNSYKDHKKSRSHLFLYNYKILLYRITHHIIYLIISSLNIFIHHFHIMVYKRPYHINNNLSFFELMILYHYQLMLQKKFLIPLNILYMMRLEKYLIINSKIISMINSISC